ncbi:MAG: peptide deformylase [bacterium]|nr:peptide deformylase [bacterium]
MSKSQTTSNKRPKKLILSKKAKILREIAKPVPIKDIGSKKIASVIARMRKAMRAEKDGVAIAAPQVGESLRIFLVDDKTLNTNKDLVFINPELVKLSRKKEEMEEGCLSLRYLYGKVLRSEKATVRALDADGRKFEIGASGLLAQIFQHETDHLNGILFTDKAKNVVNIPPKDAK